VFDKYSLDPDRRELRRGKHAIPVEPQVFDLLLYLIRRRDCVVSSDELIAAIWNGRIVSDSTVSSRLAAARRAIGDTGEKQRLIATLPRKGHRFVGSVSEDPNPSDDRAASQHESVERIETKKLPSKQTITFCRTRDDINLAVSSAGEGPVLVRTTHWLSHVEYD
jgi:DNA-binding winged helix-turn-helix (wHTH) protein